ncbi:hypothetical protein Tco_0456208 [Tanacetum coccineum]
MGTKGERPIFEGFMSFETFFRRQRSGMIAGLHARDGLDGQEPILALAAEGVAISKVIKDERSKDLGSKLWKGRRYEKSDVGGKGYDVPAKERVNITKLYVRHGPTGV